MYLHLQAFCKASSWFKLQLFALKMFHSLKRVAWLAGHVKSMPKICPSCLQPALAKGCGPLQKKVLLCPYAGPSNRLFSLSFQLLWAPLGKLKLPFRCQERSLACSYLAVLTFFPTWYFLFTHCHLLCCQSCCSQSKAGCFVRHANTNLENQIWIPWQAM